ncbi:MAG TPA: aminotransferase class I/II-fold pyridoxal phosphate-dependent enzyme [Conexivisphaerales archaeon]|nr:aminotransferase class I/II-fold pyridoxal phosphate-dependent enzyme [Conexivisphaerales archaeon]
MPEYPFARLDRIIRERRSRGERVLAFNVGDPDLPTPPFVVEALAAAVRNPEDRGYSSSEGERWFREAVSGWYSRRFGVELDPDSEVCALTGSKEGLTNVARAFVEAEDKVVVPDPAYPVYGIGGALLLGARPSPRLLSPRDGFRMNIEAADLKDVKLLYVNYPHNPTGAVADLEDLKAVVEAARSSGTLVCYDNAYSEMTYGSYVAPSILQVDADRDTSIEVHSLSKTFAMTGYRIGFAVGNRDAIRGLKAIKSQVDSGPPKFVQRAAKVALDSYKTSRRPKEVERSVREYHSRLELLARGLRRLGLKAEVPPATFYLWQRVEGSSTAFAEWLLRRGVVVTPGTAFGRGGKGYVRWSVTRPEEAIEEALGMMEES